MKLGVKRSLSGRKRIWNLMLLLTDAFQQVFFVFVIIIFLNMHGANLIVISDAFYS